MFARISIIGMAVITAAVQVTSIAFPTMAFAVDGEGGGSKSEVYVQVDMGIAPRTHANLEGFKSGRLDVDGSVFPAALTVGWKPASWQTEAGGWAVEVQAYNRNLAVDRSKIGTTTTNSSDGKLNVGGLMANVRYELKLHGGFRPYLAGGVGFDCAEIKNLPQLQLSRKEASKVGVATHFGGGVGFQPEALGRFSLWLGYDVLATQSPRFEVRSGVVPTTGFVKVKHVLPQTVTLGARFAF